MAHDVLRVLRFFVVLHAVCTMYMVARARYNEFNAINSDNALAT